MATLKMSTKRVSFLCLLACVSTLTSLSISVSAAQGTDDVISLAQKGVGEEVLLATIEASKSNFTLSATEILKLKDAKVSDKVITAMIKHKGTAASTVAAPEPKTDDPVIARKTTSDRKIESPVEDVKVAEGILNIENLDDRDWAYTYESESKTIWIADANAARGKLVAHGGVSLRMAAGTYKVRYNGQENGASITVISSEKSQLLLARVENAKVEALYISIFEKGERKAGGRIAILRENTPTVTPAVATKKSAPARVETNEVEEPVAPQTVERVVVRERVVEVPSTTVVYRDAYAPTVYVSPTYYTPHYYSSYCAPTYYSSRYSSSYCSPYRGYSSYSGHGYSSHGHRNSVSVGFGFGF
jgi:hypothetical protein